MKKPEQKLIKLTHRKKPAAPVEEPAPRVARQLPIPGTEPKVHKDVNEAAEQLAGAKQRFVSSAKFKKTKEDALIAAMKKHKLTHYVDRGLNIEIFLEGRDVVRLKTFDHQDEDKLV